MCGAGEAPVVAVVTGGVLQTEAGLVALGHHVVGVGIQQVVVAELIHAVEVSVDQSSTSQSDEESRRLVCLLRQKQSGSGAFQRLHEKSIQPPEPAEAGVPLAKWVPYWGRARRTLVSEHCYGVRSPKAKQARFPELGRRYESSRVHVGLVALSRSAMSQRLSLQLQILQRSPKGQPKWVPHYPGDAHAYLIKLKAPRRVFTRGCHTAAALPHSCY